jgi:DNA repair exonuclease SbcCD ATPase subunit
MYIQKIKIEKFKSFYEAYELNFSEVKGLWKVSGSVGSGKTTIGEAILFGLFGTITGKNNGDLVSWGQKTSTVELWCRSNGHNIYIKRTININGTSTIYVEINGEELIFTNKRDAQQQLENEYFDVSKVTMELLCIISFNNFKSLATLNTADTKKFLDQVLGFYTLTEYTDICKQLRMETDSQLNAIDRQISQVSAQIAKLKEMSNLEVIEGDIDECNEQIKLLTEQGNNIVRLHGEKLNELNATNSKLNREASKVKTLGSAKAKEIQFIEKGICPTCGAPIDQSQLEIKKAEYEALRDDYRRISKEIEDNNAIIKSTNDKHTNALKPLQAEIAKHKETIIRLKEQAKRKNVNEEAVIQLEDQKNELIKQSNVYEADSMAWERLYSILANDVRARILESFIPALNKNIMKYATELHQPYIVSFDNNFKCTVSLCGYNEVIPISALSTGQLKTVDMMIILGVLGTIIGSSSANVIFLDELFSNLDGNLRNDMCSVLHNFISVDDTMFVISHQDLDDRYFNGTIKLHLDNKGQFEKHSSINIIPNINI